MSQFGGIERPSPWSVAGDHERRIRALEAIENCCDDDADCAQWDDVVAEMVSGGATLLAWYRLGDPSGLFLDSSGQAIPANGEVAAETTPMTRHVTGGLPGAQDDGAVRFNESDGAGSDYIQPASPTEARFNLSNQDFSLVMLLNPSESASSFPGNVVGQMGSTVRSWRVYVEWPLRQVVFHRASSGTTVLLTGPPLGADEWTFVVATYNTTDGAALYYNGELVASDATTFSTGTSTNLAPYIGRGGAGHIQLERSFYGSVDEVQIWSDTLSLEQITSLTSSFAGCPTVDCAEGIDSTENVGDECGVHSMDGTTPVPEGWVLTADGAGGTYWAAP